jgi:hypothetical protein
VQRPASTRTSTLKHSKLFNEAVYLDEFEVALADEVRVLFLMILDDASSFRVVVPTDMKRSISGPKVRELFKATWSCWAGPPDTAIYDAAKGHLSDDFQLYGDENLTLMRPDPAESPNSKGRIERAIDVWKAMFAKVSRDMQFSHEHSMKVASSMITWACKNHLRKSGFTPYQFVLGRSPRIPKTAALQDGRLNLSAHDHVLQADGTRRAEKIRTAAIQAF